MFAFSSPTGHQNRNDFLAVIVSFMPRDPVRASLRQRALSQQLDWWRNNTAVPVWVIASNWADRRVANCSALQRMVDNGGGIIRVGPHSLIENRRLALSHLYASEADWGIMMDDDAILYDGAKYNSGAALFAEMSAVGTNAYKEVDVFFPINAGKKGFNPIWREDPELFRNNHVFVKTHDLKGSLFVVRNFPKYGRAPVLPPVNFEFHGEDTLFAIEALANGCTVFECQNMVLKELDGPSYFADDRVTRMREGAEEIARLYADRGLRMSTRKGDEHLLDRTAFIQNCCPGHQKRVVVPKPSGYVAPPCKVRASG